MPTAPPSTQHPTSNVKPTPNRTQCPAYRSTLHPTTPNAQPTARPCTQLHPMPKVNSTANYAQYPASAVGGAPTYLLCSAASLPSTQLSCSWEHSAVLGKSAARSSAGGGLGLL